MDELATITRRVMKKKRKWIAVIDELPSETCWVLCFGGGAITCYAFNADKQRFEDWAKCAAPGLAISEITHWRTLPPEPDGWKDIYWYGDEEKG